MRIVCVATPVGGALLAEALKEIEDMSVTSITLPSCVQPFYLEAQEERRKYELQQIFNEPTIQPNYGWYRKFEKKKF